MAHLTQVSPAPNNGTEGSLYHILEDPPVVDELPEVSCVDRVQFREAGQGIIHKSSF